MSADQGKASTDEPMSVDHGKDGPPYTEQMLIAQARRGQPIVGYGIPCDDAIQKIAKTLEAYVLHCYSDFRENATEY